MKTILSLTAAALLAGLLASPASAAALCKAPVKAHFKASANAMINPGVMTIGKWSNKVTNKYGEAYSHWNLAKDASVDCVALPNKPGWKECTAKAQPCMLMIF